MEEKFEQKIMDFHKRCLNMQPITQPTHSYTRTHAQAHIHTVFFLRARVCIYIYKCTRPLYKDGHGKESFMFVSCYSLEIPTERSPLQLQSNKQNFPRKII